MIALKRLREDKGLSQAELGKLVNYSQQMVSAIENGEKHPPTPKTMKIAKTLGVTVEELMKDEAENES